MALSDLFDSDPRSKAEMRRELDAQARRIDQMDTGLQQSRLELLASASRERELVSQIAGLSSVNSELRAASDQNQQHIDLLSQQLRNSQGTITQWQLRTENSERTLTERNAQICDLQQEFKRSAEHLQYMLARKTRLVEQLADERKLRATIVRLGRKRYKKLALTFQLLRDKIAAQAAEAARHEVFDKPLLQKIAELKQQLDTAEMEVGHLRHGAGSEVWKLKGLLQDAAQRQKNLPVELEIRGRQIESLEEKIRLMGERLKDSVSGSLYQEALEQIELNDDIIDDLSDTIRALQSNVDAMSAYQVAQQRDLQAITKKLVAEKAKGKELAKRIEASHLLARTKPASSPPPYPFSNDRVLAWMFEDATPKVFEIENGWLGSNGHDPWPEQMFKSALEDMDYVFYQLPDSDLSHVIVGRTGWDRDSLLAQIEARSGRELRIYSQEMFVAMLATGRDPFDADDPDLLVAFAEEHPALQFLISLPRAWPEVSDLTTSPIDEVGPEDYGVTESPLHLLGYRVGSRSALSEATRRELLSEFFCARDIEFSEDSSEAYRHKWGRNNSVQRLYRMAVHIKSLADGRNGKDPRRSQARLDWINDLRWLKATYFSVYAKRFSWPDVFVD